MALRNMKGIRTYCIVWVVLKKFLNIGDKNMKYSLFATALIALFLVGLVGCGDPKPGQYPPSFMDERDGAPPAED